MICKECGTKNRIKANFCSSCGHMFTDEQRRQAYAKTAFGKIEKLEELWSVLSLDKLTGSALFKILSCALVIVFGAYSVFRNGSQFRPLQSNDYEIQYNRNENEYYLISESDSIQVSLYLPKQAEEIVVIQLDESHEMISEQSFSLTEEIILINQAEVLYQIHAAGKAVQIRTFKSTHDE